MEFVQLLNSFDLHRIFQAGDNIEAKIDICCAVLTFSIKVVVVDGKKHVYNIDTKSMIWKTCEDTKVNEFTESAVRNFLSYSIAKLKIENPKAIDKFLVTKEDMKFFLKLEEGFFGKISSWVAKLVDNNVRFDEDLGGIHFANGKPILFALNKINQILFYLGRYDLISQTFSTRDPHLCYITRCIDYDYVPFATQEAWYGAMVDIEKFLLLIVREPEVLNSIASTIGKSLVDGNIKACDLLYLYGEGGCGKSTIFQLLRKTFTDVYVYEIASDAFDTSGEAQRAINGITSSHRIIVWNEPDPTKKKKSSFIKQLCDGVVTVKKLYHDGNFKIAIHGKLFVTANNIVEFDAQDTGVTRRLNYYNFKNRFVDPMVETPDPAKFVFERTEIGSNNSVLTIEQKMALFHYLAYFVHQNIARPSQIVAGKFILSLQKFHDYFLVLDEEESIALEDYITVLRKVYKYFNFGSAKDVLERMKKESPYLLINEEKYAITKKGQRSKACVEARFSPWAEEQFARCKIFDGADFDFNFTELPPISEHIDSKVSNLTEAIENLEVEEEN